MTHVTEAYSRRAAEYTGLLGSMDAVHDSDRQLVETWLANTGGRVIDAGCGPGQWTDHLARLGADVRGIDRVPTFIQTARRTYPDVRFDIESIDDIREPAGAMSGVLAWYSTIHFPPSDVAAPLAEFARVLAPGGRLVLGYFDGETLEEFPHAVAPAYRWPADDLERLLRSTGFEVVETHRRTWRDHRPHGAIVCLRQPTED